MEIIEILDSFLQDDASRVSPVEKENYITIGLAVVSTLVPKYSITKLNEVDRGIFLLPEDYNPTFSYIKRVFDEDGNNLKFKIIRVEEEQLLKVDTIKQDIYCEYSKLLTKDELDEFRKYLVGLYAAYLALQQLANFYLQTIDPLISADSVNYRAKAEQYAKRADQIKGLFDETINYIRSWV